jgi:hypothetical protein
LICVPRNLSDPSFLIPYTCTCKLISAFTQSTASVPALLVVPFHLDNLSNTGIEVHACATPVVAFRTGGLPDIVDHQRTGYGASPPPVSG